MVLSDRYPVARKQYRCWYCGQHIEQGERHGYRAGVESGDFWTMRFHLECDKVASDEKWNEEDYEFHEPGEFVRPVVTQKTHHQQFRECKSSNYVGSGLGPEQEMDMAFPNKKYLEYIEEHGKKPVFRLSLCLRYGGICSSGHPVCRKLRGVS